MAHAVLEREPVQAREDERPALERIAKRLQVEDKPKEVTFRVYVGSEPLDLPESLMRLMKEMIVLLARGEAVSIVPFHKELTTQEAADILNVSRQYLVRLLEEDKIPYHMTGTHRRIVFRDLMEYKRDRDTRRRKGLANLTQESQRLGLY